VKVTVRTPRVAELTKFMPKGEHITMKNLLLSPISGLVVAVKTEVGASVKAGQELAIIEAMKMENIITAEHDAKISKIHIKAGDNIQANQMVMEFE
jgi:propionyl-CoA carboxylase alpha chain